jgi:hypothetical protein
MIKRATRPTAGAIRRFVVATTAFGLSVPVLANDTTASTGAGGLVLKRTDAIDMVREDLYISADEIRVRYLFRNRTPHDVQTVVAFPMPDRDLSDEYYGDVAYPSGFRTNVQGRPVQSKLERKAIVKGRDYSALLRQLGIPIAPQSMRDAVEVMDGLGPADKKRLKTFGVASDEEYDDDGKGTKSHLVPLWTVKESYYWTQRFPPKRVVAIDHRYRPGAGGSVDTPIALKEFRNADLKRAIRRYCIDPEFLAAVDRLSQRHRTEGSAMPDKRIDYILTTGANWRSPIGEFRLVVDKGKPGNLVSFCETGVRKIGATQYEVRHSNWRPTRDLQVLIIEPQR